jgi:hypothetical protein
LAHEELKEWVRKRIAEHEEEFFKTDEILSVPENQQVTVQSGKFCNEDDLGLEDLAANWLRGIGLLTISECEVDPQYLTIIAIIRPASGYTVQSTLAKESLSDTRNVRGKGSEKRRILRYHSEEA